MELPQGKHPAITHPFELLYNNTTLPRFPYYTNQPPYLLQTYTKYNNHHPHSSLPHQEPNIRPENPSTLHPPITGKEIYYTGNLYDRDKRKSYPVKNVKIDIAKSRNGTTTIWLNNTHFKTFLQELWNQLQKVLGLNIEKDYIYKKEGNFSPFFFYLKY